MLFPFCLDYRGGTYLSQAEDTDLKAALARWERKTEDSDLKAWKMSRDQMIHLASGDPIALNGLKNVFCIANTDKHLALLTIIETCE